MCEEAHNSIHPMHDCDETVPQLKQENSSTKDSFGYQPKAQLQRYTESFLKRPQCRICLEEEKQNNQLITPCQCTGSVKFMHALCFDEWVKHKISRLQLQAQIINQGGITCEICKHKLAIKYVTQTRCRTRQQIQVKVKQFGKIFWLHLSFIFITILSIVGGIASMLYSQNPQNKANHGLVIQIMAGCLIGLGLIFLVLGTIDLFRKYLLVTTLKITTNDS